MSVRLSEISFWPAQLYLTPPLLFYLTLSLHVCNVGTAAAEAAANETSLTVRAGRNRQLQVFEEVPTNETFLPFLTKLQLSQISRICCLLTNIMK